MGGGLGIGGDSWGTAGEGAYAESEIPSRDVSLGWLHVDTGIEGRAVQGALEKAEAHGREWREWTVILERKREVFRWQVSLVCHMGFVSRASAGSVQKSLLTM